MFIRKILVSLFFYTTSTIFAHILINSLSDLEPKNNSNMVGAYIRVKNEIKTIEACLNSIDGIFDHIVIIHSNEKDDGSVAFMKQWCNKRKYCEIHEYPHTVFSSHDKRYRQKFKPENSLAAYYNFGLQFFQPEEWVVKIDADQVYIKPLLYQFLKQFKNGTADETKQYGLKGYNTYVYNNKLVKYGLRGINGGFDSFIIKKKNINTFHQNQYYEKLITKDCLNGDHSKPLWFHFMKSLKSNGQARKLTDAKPNEIKNLSEKEIYLFEKFVRPLLVNSPYNNVQF